MSEHTQAILEAYIRWHPVPLGFDKTKEWKLRADAFISDLEQILTAHEGESDEAISFRKWHNWNNIFQRRYNPETKEWYNYPTFLQYLKGLDPSLPLVDSGGWQPLPAPPEED